MTDACIVQQQFTNQNMTSAERVRKTEKYNIFGKFSVKIHRLAKA